MTMQSRNDLIYDEEIDVRRYVKSLISNIHWIILSAMICAIVALGVSMVLPRSYEASALVAITKPRYVLQFDPRLATTQQVQPYKAYPEIALSGDVLTILLEKIGAAPGETPSLESLRSSLSTTSTADPSLVRLVARSRNPEEAARIANLWAEAFVEHAEVVYGQGGHSQADFFAAQLSRAEADLEIAEAALIEFQAQNDVAILQNRLNSHVQTQSDYLKSQRGVTYLVQDVRNLQAQLGGQSLTYQVSLADQMTALLLQVKAFNAQSESPIQFQIDGANSLSNLTTSQQIAFLEDLVGVLELHSESATERLSEVEPRILTLQRQLQEKQIDQERLVRTRDITRESVLTLARKVQESRIAAEDNGGEAVLASRATVPTKPNSPSKMRVTAVAGVLGGGLAVVGVFALEWWREEESNQAPDDSLD
jgi:polysaccharide biosynthesis transport protein